MTDSPPNTDHRPDENQEQEWTYVKRKSRRNNTNPSAKPTEQESPSGRPPRTTDLRSVAELDVDYRAIRAQFEELGLAKKLRELVVENAGSCKRICKAVNFGVGSFDPEDAGWSMKRATYFQLTAFLVMVEELGRAFILTIKRSYSG